MKRRMPVHDNWRTPQNFYDGLDAEFHFDFDPCPLASGFDGLNCSWGSRNFCNPPYSRKLKEAFIRKAYEEAQKGKLSVLLLPVSTSTKIFHEIILPHSEIRFIKGRLKFNNTNNCGMFDSMICIFRGSEKI